MKSVPKVTVVVGGRWHAFDLARGLKKRGALHRLVTNYPWSKVKPWGFDRSEVVTLPFSQMLNQVVQRAVPDRWRARFQYAIHARFAAAAVNHLDGADVVHGWSSFSLPAIQHCRRAGVPFVLERGSSHMNVQCALLRQEASLLGLPGEFTHPEIVAMELREYELATRIAVPSRFVARTFLAEGVDERRLVRNTLGVNLGQFQPAASPPDPSVPFTAVFAGSLSFRKGLHYLVGGFRGLARPGARLRLVGGGTAETERLLGPDRTGIEWIGRVPQVELLAHYHAAHVFVIASIEEGLAMVQAQALAAGLPLICTENTGGEDLLEMIADGVPPVVERPGIRRYSAGFVVPPRDEAAITWCLQRLHDDHELRRSQREAALRIHRAPLDWQDYADRALELYGNLVAPAVQKS